MPRVLMPRVDPAMQTGKIVEWLKKEGESVEKGEPIVVVEGEKTTFELTASVDGVLHRILQPAGAEVPVAEAVAEVTAAGEPSLELEKAAEGVAPGPPKTARIAPEIVEVSPVLPAEERVRASPAARSLARQHGLDLRKIAGTGPGGRITREDVQAVVEKPGRVAPSIQVPSVRTPEVAQTLRISGVRKAVAERLSYSAKTVVPVALTVEADVEQLLKRKESMGTTTEAGLSLTAFIVGAAAEALKAHPNLNSSLDGDTIHVFKDINIAVAIDTPEGLVAPVVPNADRKTVHQVSHEIAELTEKALNRTLQLGDLTGGTFTVTNLGGSGVDTFTPVINPPNAAILGVGRISEKPKASRGGIEVKPILNLTLVFDHRITDGAPAARFLMKVKDLLEDPSQLT